MSAQPRQDDNREGPAALLLRVIGYQRFWLLGGLILSLDQLTKYWINTRLPLGSYGSAGIPIFPGFFNLVHVGNTGAAWSMFAGQSTLLAILAAATLIAIFVWRQALGLSEPTGQLIFGLLCGGISGNLIDRLVYQYVVDFIDLHFGAYIYPTFNVADSAICVGVFWYILWSIRQPALGRSK